MSEQAVAISDDALKLLVGEHGVRGTARLLGMDETQSETFRKRAYRAGWVREPELVALRAAAELPMAGRPPLPLVPKMSPIQAVSQELQALGTKTRLSIARGIAKAGAHIETMDGQEIVADAQNIKATAQTAQILHGWEANQKTSRVRLELLGTKGESMAIDVESEVVTDQDWSD